MNWTQTDAISLREYIKSNPNFIKELKARTPKIEGETTEATALSAMRHQGAEDIIKIIENDLTLDIRSGDQAGYVDTQ